MSQALLGTPHPESMVQLVRGLGIESRVEDPLGPRLGVQLKLVDWREHLQLHGQQGEGWQTTIKSIQLLTMQCETLCLIVAGNMCGGNVELVIKLCQS